MDPLFKTSCARSANHYTIEALRFLHERCCCKRQAWIQRTGDKYSDSRLEILILVWVQENVYVMWSLMEIQCEIEVNQNHPLDDAYVRTVWKFCWGAWHDIRNILNSDRRKKGRSFLKIHMKKGNYLKTKTARHVQFPPACLSIKLKLVTTSYTSVLKERKLTSKTWR